MKRYLLVLIIGLVFCSYISAQIIPLTNYQVIQESPTISQFLRYDEHPVSEYTGTPNISIPLYIIKEDGFELPLMLTYHAIGIKVQQDASWVGLGWDLSLGCIIQTINDRDDLSDHANYERQLPDYSWSPPYGYLEYPKHPSVSISESNGYKDITEIKPPTTDFAYMISTYRYISVNGVSKQYDKLFAEGDEGMDSEPDIFSISLLGTKLNVIIDFSTGNFVVLNKKGYKIKKNGETWCIINPYGEQFIFTDNEYVKTSISATDGASMSTSSRIWLLNKIITKNKKIIKLNYEKSLKPLSTVVNSSSSQIRLKVDRTNSSGIIGTPGISFRAFSGSAPFHEVIDKKITTLESQFYLSSIEYPSGIVKFTTSNNREDLDKNIAKRLDKIDVINNLQDVIKSINFNYSYFINKNSTSKRLKLQTLVENKELVYSFLYNRTQLPPKESFGQDYWGFYNGMESNASLAPNPARFGYPNVSDGGRSLDNGNNRSANLYFTKAAILEKIIYPTKGSVEFEYELNTFSNYILPDIDSLNNRISKGFGLRIKTIMYRDHEDSPLKKTRYEYFGGKANSGGKIAKVFSQKFYDIISSGYTITDYKYLDLKVEGFYLSNPLSSHRGVGYDKVVKHLESYNDSDMGIGKIETFYHNNLDIIPNVDSYFNTVQQILGLPGIKQLKQPENGSVRLINYFDQSGALKKIEFFNYKNILSNLYYGARIIRYTDFFSPIHLGYVTRFPQHLVGFYPIIDLESLLTEKVEKNIMEMDTIITKEHFYYDKYNFVSSQTKTNSLDSYYTVDNSYTSDYSGEPFQSMIKNNMLSYMIYKKESQNFNTVKTEKRNYKLRSVENGSQASNDLIDIKTHIEPSTIKVSFGGNDLQTEISYDLYDNRSNILQLTTKENIVKSYLWSYGGQYPIAEIVNATYEDVKVALGVTPESISELASPDMSKIDALRERLPNALVTTYTYKPLVGMLTSTDARGVITHYDYDDFGRLKEVYLQETLTSPKRVIESYDYKYINSDDSNESSGGGNPAQNCKEEYRQELELLENNYKNDQKSKCGYDELDGGVPSQQVQKCLSNLQQQYKNNKANIDNKYKNCQ